MNNFYYTEYKKYYKLYFKLKYQNGGQKIKEGNDVKSAKEYYFQFKKYDHIYDDVELLNRMKNVKYKLIKYDCYLLFIGWENVWDFIDNAWDDVIELLSIKYTNVMDTVSFLFYNDVMLFEATYNDGILYLQHNIQKQDVDTVYNILKNEFNERFKWNKKSDSSMSIKLIRKDGK